MHLFTVIGTFCSFGCAKSFNLSRKSINVDRACTLLSLMRCKIDSKNGRHMLTTTSNLKYGVKCAPDKYDLKMFGGSMTIDQFRKGLEVLLLPEEAENVKYMKVPKERESKIVFNPNLGMGNRQRAFLEGMDGGDWGEGDTTDAFEGLGDDEPAKKSRKRKAEPKRKDEEILGSILGGANTKKNHQMFKIQRSLPLPRESNNLFFAMNIGREGT
jgi:hypothetical protein